MKKTMRLLLVDSSQESLDSCTEKLEGLSPDSVEEVQLEARLKGDGDEYLAAIHEYDAVCFGPDMEGALAACAHAASQACPELPILVLVGSKLIDEKRYKENESFRAVFCIEDALDELESELNGIAQEQAAREEEEAGYFFGRYKIVEEIGTGAVGTVYHCLDSQNDNAPVALKVLSSDLAQEEASLTRFKNEFAATSVLEHPNIVKPYAFHEDGEAVGVAMEFVEGKSLSVYLEEKKATLGVAETIDVLSQVSSGVHALHIADIVHRNLKPDNIMIDVNGVVKVTDSGIARSEGANKLTQHGGVLGVMNYICPEYMLESKIDWRADIYALGVLSYEMLTGLTPFPGNSIMEVMNSCLNTTPKSLMEFGLQGAEGLNDIIMKALARNPEERYQSAAQMYNDLQALRGLDTSAYLELPQRAPDESRRQVSAQGVFGVGVEEGDVLGAAPIAPSLRSLQPQRSGRTFSGDFLDLDSRGPMRTILFFGGAVLIGSAAAGIVILIYTNLF